MQPPAYPRTPYLWALDGQGRDDAVLSVEAAGSWLREPVAVEEKLDGANVSIWLEQGWPRAATRGGPGALDRGRQLGPLRAWIGAAHERLATLLDDGWVLYAEWLWLTHTVVYDLLPDHLVALDLWHPDTGFADDTSRSGRVGAVGLVLPPRLFAGVLGSVDRLVGLLGTSRFGTAPMEGAVLRRPPHELCKVLRPGFERVGDDGVGRSRNRLVRR